MSTLVGEISTPLADGQLLRFVDGVFTGDPANWRSRVEEAGKGFDCCLFEAPNVPGADENLAFRLRFQNVQGGLDEYPGFSSFQFSEWLSSIDNMLASNLPYHSGDTVPPAKGLIIVGPYTRALGLAVYRALGIDWTEADKRTAGWVGDSPDRQLIEDAVSSFWAFSDFEGRVERRFGSPIDWSDY